MTVWGLLALGGAAGALARYGLATAIARRAGGSFPAGTLVVNVLGAFLLGVVVTGLATSPLRVQLAALLAVGFLGDFTTFSTFAYESVMLAREREWSRVAWYLAASLGFGVAAVTAGMLCGAFLS
jgi:fluoride exporter